MWIYARSSGIGAKYIIILTDDFTQNKFAYVLRSKTAVLEYFKEYQVYVENQRQVKRSRNCEVIMALNTCMQVLTTI